MIEKAHLSDNRVTHVSKSSTHNMAAKSSWHRYGNKLRHCHRMYTNPRTHSLTHRSACLYVPARAHSSRPAAEGLLPWREVCCHGPGRREISIDCCTAHSNVTCGGRYRIYMQVVPCCQRTYRKLDTILFCFVYFMPPTPYGPQRNCIFDLCVRACLRVCMF